ncbi:MAG: hypothetical protein ACRYF0_07820 [Janthinobacterium lividum]
MSCKTCAYPKALCLAVYCKKDPELRNLPASVGDIAGAPLIQAKAPEWCPGPSPVTSTASAPCA